MYLIQTIKAGRVTREERWYDLGQLETLIYDFQAKLGKEGRNLVKTMFIQTSRLDEFTRYRKKYNDADILIKKG